MSGAAEVVAEQWIPFRHVFLADGVHADDIFKKKVQLHPSGVAAVVLCPR